MSDSSQPLVRFSHVSPALQAHEGVARFHHVLLDVQTSKDTDASNLHAQVLKTITEANFDITTVAMTTDKLSVAVSNTSTSHATVCFDSGAELLTVSVQLALAAGQQPPSEADMQAFKDAVARFVTPPQSKASACPPAMLYPPIVRGGAFNPIVPTTDGLLIQYDFDRLVFHEQSPFQDVKIYHSQQFGNMLLLDDDPNLAESDIAYTHAILGNSRYSYEDKTVLILGGGDGGILNEVLKLGPKSVVMAELDKVVIDAAVKHLRGICSNSMDMLNGDNYEIIIGDCIPFLKEKIAQGVKYNFVINDLTAVPVTEAVEGGDWDFLQLVLGLALDVLADDGKYITQGNGANMTAALALYEKVILEQERKVEFSKEPICVPSFHEMWMFYTLWFA